MEKCQGIVECDSFIDGKCHYPYPCKHREYNQDEYMDYIDELQQRIEELEVKNNILEAEHSRLVGLVRELKKRKRG